MEYKAGDRVSIGGNTATVINSFETLHIKWDYAYETYGTWPASDFTEVERAFDEGQFVRVISNGGFKGEVGIIFEDDGAPETEGPYWVGVFDEFESEESFSASELIPWVPHVGDRVIERGDDEGDEVGTVLACDGYTARILWDGYRLAQEFPVSDLEPADESEVFEVGDTVEYCSPVFAGPIEATIIGFDDVGLRVRFTRDFLPEGNYSKYFFTKAA